MSVPRRGLSGDGWPDWIWNGKRMVKAQWDDREDWGRPRSPRVQGCVGLRGVAAAMMNLIHWQAFELFPASHIQCCNDFPCVAGISVG